MIDEARIYDVPLASAQIAVLANPKSLREIATSPNRTAADNDKLRGAFLDQASGEMHRVWQQVSALRHHYASGRSLEELWDDLNTQLDVLFPTSGKTETGKAFYSHANRSWQQFVRQVLEAILSECQQDFHLTALRNNSSYRYFHKTIRNAQDARLIRKRHRLHASLTNESAEQAHR